MHRAILATLGFLALSTMAAPSAGAAVIAAYLGVQIDGGDIQTFETRWDSESKRWYGEGSVQTTQGDSVTLSLDADPDPSLLYGFAVIDGGAASSFVILVGTPIILGPGPNVVTASISAGLGDATGDGVSITPFAQATVQSSFVSAPDTAMGVDVGPAAAHGPAAPQTYSYGAFNAGPIAGPVGAWGSMGVVTSFTLSGGGDSFTGTGIVTINNVIPEPSSMALAGTAGLVALGLVARRRARA